MGTLSSLSQSAAERKRRSGRPAPSVARSCRPWMVRPASEARGHEICLSHMVEPHTHEEENSGPRGWCVCGQKVTIADPREVTLPNGRPGWEGHCPECGSPLFAIRRKRRAADARG